MRRMAGLLAACGILAVGLLAAPRPEDAEPGNRPGAASSRKPIVPIAWRRRLEAAKASAAKQGVCTLIYFRADWCKPCRFMEKGAFVIPAVAQFMNRHFIPVEVDDSAGRGEIAQAYKIRVYPSVLFLDPGGEPLHLVLGPREPERFYRIMQQVKELPGLMDRQHSNPDSLEANFALGNAFAKLNHLKRAAPYLEKAAQLDPENAHGRQSQARLILAVVPLEDGNSALALANLEDYLEAFGDAPEAPVAVWYQGAILYQDGRLEEAKRYFQALIQRFPKHHKAYEADKAIEHIDARLRAEAEAGEGAKPSEPPASPIDDRPEPKG